MNECCHNDNHLLAGTGIPEAAPLDHYLQRGRFLRAAAVHAGARRLARLLDPRKLAELPRAIARAHRARRNRRELLSLDEHQLHDIGLTHHDVERITGIDPRRQGHAPGGDPLSSFRGTHFNR